ncbi:DUF3343 domain-containing protein [Gemmatimonadota bacterium]
MTESGGEGPLFFLFENTTQVLWAEEVAQEEGIPVDVVPAPVKAKDICGLALQTLPSLGPRLEAVLKEEGIPVRKHR